MPMPALHPTRPLPRVVAITAGTLAGLLLLAAPALAHVTVSSPGATQGGYAKITFRVPTEEDDPTTEVEVVLPADAPLASVSVKPHPGWTYTTTTATPATPLSDDDGPVTSVVTGITWTATDGGIKPGEFDEFDISAGPLPTTSSMEFKALQTYADGTVVRWIEETPADGTEPDHPAPVLQLAAAGSTGTGATGSTGSTSSTAVPVAQVSAQREDQGTGSSRGLSIAALAVAVVAALLGAGALVRARRPSA